MQTSQDVVKSSHIVFRSSHSVVEELAINLGGATQRAPGAPTTSPAMEPFEWHRRSKVFRRTEAIRRAIVIRRAKVCCTATININIQICL